MVDVMGQTPEEFEEMLNAQIAEGERKAAALDEFLATLESARVTGFDSRREVEVEVNQEGTMTRVSIDDDALEGSASDLEEAIMEAYSDAGKNMRPKAFCDTWFCVPAAMFCALSIVLAHESTSVACA